MAVHGGYGKPTWSDVLAVQIFLWPVWAYQVRRARRPASDSHTGGCFILPEGTTLESHSRRCTKPCSTTRSMLVKSARRRAVPILVVRTGTDHRLQLLCELTLRCIGVPPSGAGLAGTLDCGVPAAAAALQPRGPGLPHARAAGHQRWHVGGPARQAARGAAGAQAVGGGELAPGHAGQAAVATEAPRARGWRWTGRLVARIWR